MARTRVVVTLEGSVLTRLDRLVRAGLFSNRSQAIEVAVMEKLERLQHRRLAVECAKLDSASEQSLADEGLGADAYGWTANG